MANGKSVAIEDVPDEVFATKMMGDGIAVIPDEGKIYAPCDGTISMIMDNTKHALGIKTEDGIEMLIHVGLDTVNLLGEGFETHVATGDQVEAGELLITYDKEKLDKEGINDHKIVNYHTDKSVRIIDTPLIEYE